MRGDLLRDTLENVVQGSCVVQAQGSRDLELRGLRLRHLGMYAVWFRVVKVWGLGMCSCRSHILCSEGVLIPKAPVLGYVDPQGSIEAQGVGLGICF